MDEQMFNSFPDMLKVMQNPHIHTHLKELGQQFNFDQLRKLMNDWVTELERRVG